VILPTFLTRDGWYARLHAAQRDAPRLLGPLEREVLMGAAARNGIASGHAPPFQLRAGLIVEMLAFYDELRRRDQGVQRFEDLLTEKLEGSVEDRGAARLLQQTHFLAAAFRAYEQRVVEGAAIDEHALRERLLAHGGSHPFRRLVVSVGDRLCDPPGLWTADFDLIARINGLEEIDIVSTEAVLSAGWHQRLDALMPGIEEVPPIADSVRPVLVAPPRETDRLHFLVRDREEELATIARRLKAERRRDPETFDLDRHAVVFKRPLPYLYLARTVFASAGIAFGVSDAVPLAAEPYAAALDLLLDVVSSGFTRSSIVALLRSPQFALGENGSAVPLASVRALDYRLSEAGFLGDLDALARIVDEMPESSEACVAARAARTIVERLRPFTEPAPASVHLSRLADVLTAWERPGQQSDRHLRAREAILAAIADLQDAHARRDDPETTLTEVASRLRRWIDAQTFRPPSPAAGGLHPPAGGLQLLDAAAAAFGTYDAIHIVGLVERDWPEPVSTGVFYAPRLLTVLGWGAEPDRAAGARAAFKDLLTLPARRVACHTVTLEDEAVVEASPLLDELAASSLAIDREVAGDSRIFVQDALSHDAGHASAAVQGSAADWLARRREVAALDRTRFEGRGLPHVTPEVSVSAVERYLECAFKYFAIHVLDLDEEPEDEDVMSPRARGVFIHQVFQTFFEEWGTRGTITPERLEDARTLFADVAERLLGRLRPAEAALERARLLGSAVAIGLGDAVFRMEAERPAPVVERLLEFRVRGEFDVQDERDVVHVRVRGVADRIDVLGDGTLRVLDYKTGKAPQPRRALQLPLYSLCAARQLSSRDGRERRVGEAAYLAFGGPRAFVPMSARGGDEQAMRDAQSRLATAVIAIRRGEFLVQPLEPFRCTFCAYAGVCRKDYVGDE
jgi:RecB family exonuclease